MSQYSVKFTSPKYRFPIIADNERGRIPRYSNFGLDGNFAMCVWHKNNGTSINVMNPPNPILQVQNTLSLFQSSFGWMDIWFGSENEIPANFSLSWVIICVLSLPSYYTGGQKY